MSANMASDQATVKPKCTSGSKWTGKEPGTQMTEFFETVSGAFLFFGPFIALAAWSAIFGADSRPGIDDSGPRRWMP